MTALTQGEQRKSKQNLGHTMNVQAVFFFVGTALDTSAFWAYKVDPYFKFLLPEALCVETMDTAIELFNDHLESSDASKAVEHMSTAITHVHRCKLDCRAAIYIC